MASSTKILGPPSVAGKISVVDQTRNTVPSVEDLFAKSLKLGLDDYLPMGLTEQGSATYLSTGNPCLDFFFHIVPNTPADHLIARLHLAWAQDAITALKLICNLRGVRGTGKSDKEGFYAAALWLYNHHPKTLALNAKALAEFGYFKDFVEILYRILEGLDVRKRAKQDRQLAHRRKMIERKRLRQPEDHEVRVRRRRKNSKKAEKSHGSAVVVDNGTARAVRKEREIAKATRDLNQYDTDEDPEPEVRVTRIQRRPKKAKRSNGSAVMVVDKEMARALRKEREMEKATKALNNFEIQGLLENQSGSKVVPYKSLLICEAIARRIFPKEQQYEGMEDRHYAYRVRDRLRKEILVPLHKALQLPEVYMSAGEWNTLPYGRVPSVAMKKYKDHFIKHDKERFEEYLENVKNGKAKIAAGALLPHEIISQLEDYKDGGAVAELQWARMVEDMLKKGKMSNCIAVCDVSGSMSGTPMEVCVALGLLVSELSEEPWKGKVITFSQDPEMHLVEGSSLKEKTEFIRWMEWGMSTNFYKVFDKILETAVANKLSEDQLIKRVFVFSDMEFHEASRGETDYEAIERKFGEKGYKKVPEVVFWNLRDSKATPVLGTQNGVALVSGFSKNLLTLFMDGGGILNPEESMGLAIAGEEYQKLVVHD
ncbi:Uncharacterized protein L728 [Linum grandiflorum]